MSHCIEILTAYITHRTHKNMQYVWDILTAYTPADAFKIVVCVVLQVEERLQVVFPPKGGAKSLFYLVLTHRGAVPHYRSVSVGDRHVLPVCVCVCVCVCMHIYIYAGGSAPAQLVGWG